MTSLNEYYNSQESDIKLFLKQIEAELAGDPTDLCGIGKEVVDEFRPIFVEETVIFESPVKRKSRFCSCKYNELRFDRTTSR